MHLWWVKVFSERPGPGFLLLRGWKGNLTFDDGAESQWPSRGIEPTAPGQRAAAAACLRCACDRRGGGQGVCVWVGKVQEEGVGSSFLKQPVIFFNVGMGRQSKTTYKATSKSERTKSTTFGSFRRTELGLDFLPFYVKTSPPPYSTLPTTLPAFPPYNTPQVRHLLLHPSFPPTPETTS